MTLDQAKDLRAALDGAIAAAEAAGSDLVDLQGHLDQRLGHALDELAEATATAERGATRHE